MATVRMKQKTLGSEGLTHTEQMESLTTTAPISGALPGSDPETLLFVKG